VVWGEGLLSVANVGAADWTRNDGSRVASSLPTRDAEVAEVLLALDALLWADIEVVAQRTCQIHLRI
jgi:hypothetical protein